MGVKYQIIYWRDIPAQVKVREGRNRISKQLPKRFEQAIDTAAMKSGATSTDAYLQEWRQTDWLEDRDGEAEAIAEALVQELDEAYPKDRVQALVKNGGVA